MVFLATALVWILALAVLVAAFELHRHAEVRRRRGEPLLPFEPRPSVPWGLRDIVVIVVMMLLTQLAARWCVGSWYEIEPAAGLDEWTEQHVAAMLLAGSVANLLTVFLAWLHMWRLVGATLRDLGIDLKKAAADTRAGVAAFLMLAVYVYAVQTILTRLVPPSHPIVTLLTRPAAARFYLIAGLAAVIVAPIAEEYVYRVLLQGWLENVSAAIRAWRANPAGDRDDLVLLLVGQWEVAPGLRPLNVGHLAPTAQKPLPPGWPIVVSALVFALMHWGHGPDPVALFILALGLGYLYQRTGRVWPCIVVHSLVNSVALGALWLERPV